MSFQGRNTVLVIFATQKNKMLIQQCYETYTSLVVTEEISILKFISQATKLLSGLSALLSPGHIAGTWVMMSTPVKFDT